MRFAKLLQWPVVCVALAVFVNDKWPAVVFTLALVYRREVSKAIRRLRIVELPGLKGYLSRDATAVRRRRSRS